MDLNQIDKFTFEYGIILQLKIELVADHIHCIALFNNGSLGEFNYNKKNKQKMEDFQLIESGYSHHYSVQEDYLPSNNNLQDHDINAKAKIIKFDSVGKIIIYTDGFRIYKMDGNKTVSTKKLKSIIIDLTVGTYNGKDYIFILDRNGKILSCDFELSSFVLIGASFGLSKLTYISQFGILVATDYLNSISKRYLPFQSRNKVDSIDHQAESEHFHFQSKKVDQKIAYFYDLLDGSLNAYRSTANSFKLRKLLQIVVKAEGVVFCTNEMEYNIFKNEKLCIIGFRFFQDYFILITENGLLLKVFFN